MELMEYLVVFIVINFNSLRGISHFKKCPGSQKQATTSNITNLQSLQVTALNVEQMSPSSTQMVQFPTVKVSLARNLSGKKLSKKDG